MPEWLGYLALFATGLVAGALNVLAGGGSFLTLPVLLWLDLPAVAGAGLPVTTVANGTNRVGILLQNMGAVWGFHRYRVVPWGWALAAILPALVGAALGTWAALHVGDRDFRRILAFLMVAVTLGTFLRPRRRQPQRQGFDEAGGEGSGEDGRHPPAARLRPLPSTDGWPPRPWLLASGFFLVGVYGGFVQAGVGFLILAVTSWTGLDLVRGNALKVVSILAFTVLSLTIFASQGAVAWWPGLVLGAGTALGGQAGVRWTVLRGHAFVRWVVTVTVVTFAVLLWLDVGS